MYNYGLREAVKGSIPPVPSSLEFRYAATCYNPSPFPLKIVSVLTIIIVSLCTMIMQVQMLTVGWKLGKVLNKDSKAQSTCEYALCLHVLNV